MIFIILGIVLLVVIIYLITRIRVVRQTNKYIIERFGGYHTTWGVGIN